MHVIFHVARKVEVDYSLDLLDVQAPSRNVCGNQDWSPSVLEFIQSPRPLMLVFVSMHGRAWCDSHQRPLQLIAHALGRAKDNDACTVALLADDVLQHVVLGAGAVVDDVHDLRHVFVGNKAVGIADVDNGRRFEKLTRQAPHFFRPRSCEEECLARGGDARHDLANLRLEAHIKHAICLIKNHVRHLVQINLAALKEVVEPAGCGHHYRAAIANVAKLIALGRTTIHAGRRHADASSEFLALLLDLSRQLASWGENKDSGSVPRVLATAVHDVHEAGHKEAKGFPRPSLRHANYVAAFERGRPSLRLDDRRNFETSPRELSSEHLRNRRVGELENRF